MVKQIPGLDFFAPHSMVIKGKVRGLVWVLDRNEFNKAEEAKDGIEDIDVSEDNTAEAIEHTVSNWNEITTEIAGYLARRPFSSVPHTRRLSDAQDTVRMLRLVSKSVGEGELAIRVRYGADGFPEMIFLGSQRVVLQKHLTHRAWSMPTEEEFFSFVNKWSPVMELAGLKLIDR